MDPSFGTRLRMQRERQQVALSAIAEQTKIKRALLDGLERDDLTHWPGGIFRRSYVRAYAVAIGLEPDPVVREFLDLYPDPEDDSPVMAAMARAVDTDPNRRPPTRLGNLISSAIGALPTLRSAPRPGPSRGSAAPHEPDGMVPSSDASQEVAWEDAAPASPPLLSDVRSELAGDVSLRLPASDAAADLFDSMVPAEMLSRAAVAHDHDGPTTSAPAAAPAPEPNADLSRLAALCTRLSRATDAGQIAPVLAETARMLDAVGLMLWTWNAATGQLAPALVHGYHHGVVAQLPGVSPEDDNTIAWAFRSEQTRTISGSDLATGALAVPLMSPSGCTGVLALELRHGHEQHDAVRAVVEILAAQLSALVGHPPASGAQVAV